MNYYILIPSIVIMVICILYRIIKNNEKSLFNIYLKGVIHAFIFILCYGFFKELGNNPKYLTYWISFFCIFFYFSEKINEWLFKLKISKRYKNNLEDVMAKYKHQRILDNIYFFQILGFYLVYIIKFYLKI